MASQPTQPPYDDDRVQRLAERDWWSSNSRSGMPSYHDAGLSLDDLAELGFDNRLGFASRPKGQGMNLSACIEAGWNPLHGLTDFYVRVAKAAPLPARPPVKRKRRPPADPRPPTQKQAEAVQIVGECKGNIAEAARRLKLDRKTVEQQYKAAMKKLGRLAVPKPKTQRHPTDRRGQATVTEDRRTR